MAELDIYRIMKRDQRTIKTRIPESSIRLDRNAKSSRGSGSIEFSISRFPIEFFRISNLGMDAISGNRPESRSAAAATRIRLNHLINRLVEVFVLGVCLLTIVRAPTAMSAPASRSGSDGGADESFPKWKYPCGPNHEFALDNDSGTGSSGESDRDIIRPVLTIAEMARTHLNGFKEDYVMQTFGAPFDVHHSTFKSCVYPWLPNADAEIPKSLDESVNASHLESRRLDEFLTDIYESMQKYAVGIEQVVWDQERTNGYFLDKFSEAEANLRKVLCELLTAMINKNVRPRNDVDRSIMDEQTRNMNHIAETNLRDWIIFREYMNGLDYLIQVLMYIDENPPS